MEPGNIVEFIDRQKILCAIVLEVKENRLRILTENNRELKLSANRLSHISNERLDPASGRDHLIGCLKDTANRRNTLKDQIDVKELWEVLYPEGVSVDLSTMAGLCFSEANTGDQEAAVIRAFFYDRVYFKFSHDNFMPNSEAQIENIIAQKKEEERKERLIKKGGDWLKNAFTSTDPDVDEDMEDIVDILKSYYLYDKESPEPSLAKAILSKAGVEKGDKLFGLLVRFGVWDTNENLDLIRYNIPIQFSDKLLEIVEKFKNNQISDSDFSDRKDLTHLPVMTIDGEMTLDFDDALSIEKEGNDFRVGIHIVDVGYFVKKGDEFDTEALSRVSSIYTPDQKISMLPPGLSEDMCSLKAGEIRPAISISVLMNAFAKIKEYQIFHSIIKVKDKLSYNEIDGMVIDNESIKSLYTLAEHFRKFRLNAGGLQITLPEISIFIDENSEIILNKYDRESPGRMLVAEMMILANWLMATFLKENETSAIFRSQPPPKNRLIKDDQGTLFENCVQRKMISRGILNNKADFHSGLGLDAYITATSPIRKYFDLVTQRQIRSVLGLEEPYTPEEINYLIQILEQPMRDVGRIQFMRKRYWILKYLEKKIGTIEEAIILDRKRSFYVVLLPQYMLECTMALSNGINLKPKDFTHVKIQHVNARNDVISIYVG